MPKKPKSFTKHIRDKYKPEWNWGLDSIRGNRHERGYGNDWEKLRNSYIAEHALCEICLQIKAISLATDVDHIIPFRGIGDPNRLNRNNLQALCKTCHNRKTARG